VNGGGGGGEFELISGSILTPFYYSWLEAGWLAPSVLGLFAPSCVPSSFDGESDSGHAPCSRDGPFTCGLSAAKTDARLEGGKRPLLPLSLSR